MLPNGTRARVMRMTLLLLVAAAVTRVALRSFGAKPTTVRRVDERLEAAALERERRPRCGRRCGMVLGAVSIVALGIAVDHTRRLVDR